MRLRIVTYKLKLKKEERMKKNLIFWMVLMGGV